MMNKMDMMATDRRDVHADTFGQDEHDVWYVVWIVGMPVWYF